MSRGASCRQCGRPIEQPALGRPREFCAGGGCRKAAWLRRVRAVPEQLPRLRSRPGRRRLGPADVRRWRRQQLIGISRRRQRPGAGSILSSLEAQRQTMEDWWREAEEALTEVPHAVIGGVAANTYMAPRLTADLDLAVTAARVPAAAASLAATGWQPRGALSLDDPQMAGSSWQDAAGHHLDLVGLRQRWAAEAIREAGQNRVEGLPIMTLPYLALLKLAAGRLTDTGDLARMLAAADEPAWERVRAVVERWSREDVHDLEEIRELGRLERDPAQAPGAPGGREPYQGWELADPGTERLPEREP